MALLKIGSRGNAVKNLQQQLVENGYEIGVDGIFGQGTAQTIKDFQEKHGLAADGIAGPATQQALDKGAEPERTDPARKIKKLTDQDIIQTAEMLGVEVPAVKAVCAVESRGSGFLADGRPKILFEGHIFWSQLKKNGLKPEDYTAGHEDILYPKWVRTHYKGGVGEYDRLEKAIKIHEIAALASASWGMFQIMGFNYGACEFGTVKSFVTNQYENEGEHLKAFAQFIRSARLVGHLKNKNWAAFAKGYNGSAYAKNKYDQKLEKAYQKALE